MKERFLRYSLTHGRKIKAVLLTQTGFETANILVTDLTEDTFTFVSARNKVPRTEPLSVLMAASYARGDHGEE